VSSNFEVLLLEIKHREKEVLAFDNWVRTAGIHLRKSQIEKTNVYCWNLQVKKRNSLLKFATRKKKVHCQNSQLEKNKVHCWNSQVEKVKFIVEIRESKVLKFAKSKFALRNSQSQNSHFEIRKVKFALRNSQSQNSHFEIRKKFTVRTDFETRKNKNTNEIIFAKFNRKSAVYYRKIKSATFFNKMILLLFPFCD